MNLVNSKDLLAAAQGRSEFVVAVFADIRGFSKFSRSTESPNIAMYVKRLYLELLDKYFPNATYSKPTGDGLLLIFPYDETSLKIVFQAVVDACIRCHSEFQQICSDDLMLNFSLPSSIGFGIARGTACCLFSGDQIIDYSGHLLNLCARLNDVARPSGVVIDGTFRNGLLTQEQASLFSVDRVYLRGVAEEKAVEVLVQKDVVIIGNIHKAPLLDEKWLEEEKTFSDQQFFDFSGNFKKTLTAAAIDSNSIKLELTYKRKNITGYFAYKEIEGFKYVPHPKPHVLVAFDTLRKDVSRDDIEPGSELVLRISYRPAVSTP